MSTKYNCQSTSPCVQCDASELTEFPYCQTNGYKQPVQCQWLDSTPQEYRDHNKLPQFVSCDNVGELERRAFLRNHLTFVVLGFIAFGVYVWRRKRIYTSYQAVS